MLDIFKFKIQLTISTSDIELMLDINIVMPTSTGAPEVKQHTMIMADNNYIYMNWPHNRPRFNVELKIVMKNNFHTINNFSRYQYYNDCGSTRVHSHTLWHH